MLSAVGFATAVTSLRVGGVVSIENELTESVLLGLSALSVTVMVQLLYVPPDKADVVPNVIVLLPLIAVLLSLLQFPPTAIVPASVELKV